VKTLVLVIFGLLLVGVVRADEKKSVLDRKMKGLDGKEVDLAQFKGKVVVLVNVASKCGLTPQYKGLQEIYDKYKDQGLVIVGVPANEFGKQEPGTDQQIAEFCEKNYKVTFPMLSKVVVKGEGQCDLYRELTGNDAKPIAWNFTKFVVSRNGEVVQRFEPRTKPEEMTRALEAELGKK
jgi:glutathione peroxidase